MFIQIGVVGARKWIKKLSPGDRLRSASGRAQAVLTTVACGRILFVRLHSRNL